LGKIVNIASRTPHLPGYSIGGSNPGKVKRFFLHFF